MYSNFSLESNPRYFSHWLSTNSVTNPRVLLAPQEAAGIARLLLFVAKLFLKKNTFQQTWYLFFHEFYLFMIFRFPNGAACKL